MNDVSENENEKVKKAQETTEAKSDENYEAEEMEIVEEGTDLGEIPYTENDVSSPPCSTTPRTSNVQSESYLVEKSLRDSYDQARKDLFEEKLKLVTGKRPKNLPVVKKFRSEEKEEEITICFGDRRPAEIEKCRKEKWMKLIAIESAKESFENLGRLRREIRIPYISEGLTCVRFDHLGGSLATAYKNGGVQVRKTFTGELSISLKTLELNDKLPVSGLSYHPYDGRKLYLAGESGFIQIFDTKSGTLIASSDNITQIYNIDISRDGHNLVTTGKNGRVCVCDPSTLRVVSVRERPNINQTTTSAIDTEYHKLRVFALKFHPTESNFFVTGGWDSSVKVLIRDTNIWDVRLPGAVFSINGPFICGDGIDIQDNSILTASWTASDSLKIWDFSTRKLLRVVPIKTKSTKYEGEFLYTARFFKNVSFRKDLAVVGGSGFNETSVINLNTGKIIASFPSYKVVVTLDTFENYVAYGGKESLFRIGEVVFPS